MPSSVHLSEFHRPGDPVVLDSSSPTAPVTVVFEDDGETAYFYAVDPGGEEMQILDALHVYEEGSRASRPVCIEILWRADGMASCVAVDGHPKAVFDFEARRGCCRSGFPPGPLHTGWSQEGHVWDDRLLAGFA